jgi:hypothetical protein
VQILSDQHTGLLTKGGRACRSNGCSSHHPQLKPSRVNEPTSTPTGPSAAPDFKKVRSYLRTIQQREALGCFMRAGWSPDELTGFARAVYLAPGKTYPTAASYQYAIEKGADHPYAKETLASLRATSVLPRVTLGPQA